MIAFLVGVALFATSGGKPVPVQTPPATYASAPAAQADFVTRIDGVIAALQPISTSTCAARRAARKRHENQRSRSLPGRNETLMRCGSTIHARRPS